MRKCRNSSVVMPIRITPVPSQCSEIAGCAVCVMTAGSAFVRFAVLCVRVRKSRKSKSAISCSFRIGALQNRTRMKMYREIRSKRKRQKRQVRWPTLCINTVVRIGAISVNKTVYTSVFFLPKRAKTVLMRCSIPKPKKRLQKKMKRLILMRYRAKNQVVQTSETF